VAESELERYPLLKIHGSLDSLPAAERGVAEFILDHPRETIDATIEELAELSSSSYATISRFCKRMGYGGFKDFRKQLIDDIVTQRRGEISGKDLEVHPGLTVSETIARVSQFTGRVLEETEAVLDPEHLSAAADAVMEADTVLCIGAGTSAITARYAYTRLFRLGIACTAEPDAVVFSMRAAAMKPGDVLLAVSSSGRTGSVVAAAEAARERGATVVAVSDYAISPLNRAADITLYTTPRTANVFLTTELPLVVGQVLIVDALFGVLATRVQPEAEETYRRTKGAADQSKL